MSTPGIATGPATNVAVAVAVATMAAVVALPAPARAQAGVAPLATQTTQATRATLATTAAQAAQAMQAQAAQASQQAAGAAPGADAATADPRSDAPEGERPTSAVVVPEAASYEEALARWHDAGHVNAWIGRHFQYDRARALQLSETQRQRHGTLPIVSPPEFFARPSGVCVDLARFGVETLRRIDPAANARYLMIEFDPLTLAGQTLRRHWVAMVEQGGQRYFFADSKRPGVMAGPYADTRAFIVEYERYRGRRIVAFQERASFERQQRQTRQARPAETRPAASPASAPP